MTTFLTYSDARRSGTAWRQATGTYGACQRFVFTHYFSELRVLFGRKDEFTEKGKRMRENKAFLLFARGVVVLFC